MTTLLRLSLRQTNSEEASLTFSVSPEFQSTRPRGARLYVSLLFDCQSFIVWCSRTGKRNFSLIIINEGLSYKSLIINWRENTLFFAMLCIRNIRLSIPRKHHRMFFCRYSPLDCSNCFQENRNECYLSHCQS